MFAPNDQRTAADWNKLAEEVSGTPGAQHFVDTVLREQRRRAHPVPGSDWLPQLQSATEHDGVRVLKHRMATDAARQFFVSSKSQVSPAQIIRSVKGRLQYLVRADQPRAFQRNYAVRSIGAATRSVVEGYVAKQMNHHSMADERVQSWLAG